MSRVAKLALMGAALMTATPGAAFAQGRAASATNAQKMQANAAAEVPRCTRKLGTHLGRRRRRSPSAGTQYNRWPRRQKLLRS
jgi:hypothetical protein